MTYRQQGRAVSSRTASIIGFSLFFDFKIQLIYSGGIHTCHSTYMEVRGQSVEVVPLLPPFETQELNSGYPVWQ